MGEILLCALLMNLTYQNKRFGKNRAHMTEERTQRKEDRAQSTGHSTQITCDTQKRTEDKREEERGKV